MRKIRLSIIALVLLMVSGCAKEDLGAFRVSNEGVIQETDSKAPVTIDMFFDPSCPPCAIVGDMADDVLSEYMESGDLEIVYHPVAFLNGPNDYSKLVSASILSVADNAPDKVYEYMRSVITQSFQKENRDSEDVLEVLEAHLLEFGFTQEVDKIIADLDENVKKVEAITEDFTKPNSKWSKFSPEGSVFAPYILINKTGKLENEVFQPQGLGGLADDISEAIENIK